MRTLQSHRARLVLVVAALLGGLAFVMNRDLDDVRVYWAGGRAAASGGGLYSFRVGADGFTYPPFAAMLFAGLAWLPVQMMWGVLVAGSMLAFILVVRISAPGLVARCRRGEVPAAVTLGSLVLAQPLSTTLRLGQVDLDIVALVLVDLLVLRRGYLLGIATAIKLTPGLFIVYLLIRGRHREARGAAAAFATSVVIGWCAMPGESARFWLHDIVTGSGIGGFDRPNNLSVRGLAEQLLGPAAGDAAWLVLVPPVLVVGLTLARRSAIVGHDVIAVGLVGLTACLVSPVSWSHAWVWIIPVLAGWTELGCRRRRLQQASFAVVVFWTFVPTDWIEPGWLRPLNTGYVVIALAAGGIAAFCHRPMTKLSQTADVIETFELNHRTPALTGVHQPARNTP